MQGSIVVDVMGGLGNQLFQYAFGRALSIKNDIPLILNKSWFYKNKNRLFLLDKYNTKYGVVCKENMSAEVIKEGNIPDPFIPQKGVVYRLFGYWQSEEYFKDYRKVLLCELKADTKPIEIKKNAVSIHVRRTDYISKPGTKVRMVNLSTDYYSRAMKHIQARVKNPVFYVFSDDIEWCKDNLKANDMIYMDNANLDDPTKDLRFMSACDHNIIANSTFSWWGAWLNLNRDKIVVAPDKWYKPEVNADESHLIPKEWVKIDV